MRYNRLIILTFALLLSLPCIAGQAQWFEAAKQGDIATCKLLLGQGIQVDATNKQGHTALFIASHNGHKTLVDYLIAKGAEIDFRSASGYTPLHLAAQNNHLDVVKKLIEAGASINNQSYDGNTALGLAARKESLSTVQYLLSHGANPAIKNGEGDSALQLATDNWVNDIILGTMNSTSLVFDLPSKNIDDEQFTNALMTALRGRGWTPKKITAQEYTGRLQKKSRIFRIHIQRFDKNILLEFLPGYGSNRNFYLRNIKFDTLSLLDPGSIKHTSFDDDNGD